MNDLVKNMFGVEQKVAHKTTQSMQIVCHVFALYHFNSTWYLTNTVQNRNKSF